MAELQITSPQGRSRTHRLGEGSVILGRDPSCDIPLEDLGASRRHAAIRFENESYLLEDLGSKNGTVVNDVLTQRATLGSGDEILIGAVRAVFRDDADVHATASVVLSDDRPRQKSTTYRGDADDLELPHRRLEILYQLTERLTRLRDRDELLGDAMEVCFEMLRFERGAIAVKQAKGKLVDWPVVRNLRGSEGELKVSRTILSSALVHGERVIVNDTDEGPIDPTISMVQHNIRSAMCVPLLTGEENLGAIYGDQVTTGTSYSKEDVDFFAGIARLVTTGLVNARLLDEQKLKLQLESEVAMAREIQTGLFPARFPDRADLKVAALNDPGRHVSGDYYDVIELHDGRLAFLIADVTGEGVAASLLMANLQAAVRLTLSADQSLDDLLNQWNTLICDNTDASRFITCLIGIIDPATRKLEMGVAGHHLPYLVRQEGTCTILEMEPEYPLGVMRDSGYRSQAFDIHPGRCTIVAYTDGVVEAMSEDAEQYGNTRVEALLRGAADCAPQRMIERLRQGVREHGGSQPQGDDITILAVQLP